jgi:hypothetical protein
MSARSKLRVIRFIVLALAAAAVACALFWAAFVLASAGMRPGGSSLAFILGGMCCAFGTLITWALVFEICDRTA